MLNRSGKTRKGPPEAERRGTVAFPPIHRWGFVTYDVNDATIEVIVPDAPGERQGRRELHLYLGT